MKDISHLNYRVFGDGHPVVFLHGFLESISMWSNFKLESTSFKNILNDLPGHGNSELLDTNEHPSMEFMASKVLEVIDKLGIEKYHIVGHSMGGYVALVLKETDERCEKVILLNSNFWEDSAEKKNDRIRVADIALKSKNLFVQEAVPGLFFRHDRKDKVVQDLIKEAQNIDADAIAYSSLAMRNRRNHRGLLINNQNDFLLIQGENDPLISPDKMKREIDGMGIALKIVNQTGHMSHIEAPEKTVQLIKEFLE